MPAAAAAAALFLAFAAQPPLAQPPPAEPPTLKGVEVPGRPAADTLRAQVHAFVDSVSMREEGQSLMRWHEPVCPLVAGLPAAQGEFILARISQVARAAHAPLAPAGRCTPNFYVVVTGDPEALLTLWRRRDANLFGQQPRAQVGRFIGADRPIRVWHNWSYSASDHSATTRNQDELYNALVVRHADDSRQVTNVVRGVWGAVIVVDSGKVGGLSVAQIADYVALTGLAEVNPDADPAAGESILRLFDTPPAAAPSGLSAWDRAFLAALYQSQQESVRQRVQIAARMLTALGR